MRGSASASVSITNTHIDRYTNTILTTAKQCQLVFMLPSTTTPPSQFRGHIPNTAATAWLVFCDRRRIHRLFFINNMQFHFVVVDPCTSTLLIVILHDCAMHLKAMRNCKGQRIDWLRCAPIQLRVQSHQTMHKADTVYHLVAAVVIV